MKSQKKDQNYEPRRRRRRRHGARATVSASFVDAYFDSMAANISKKRKVRGRKDSRARRRSSRRRARRARDVRASDERSVWGFSPSHRSRERLRLEVVTVPARGDLSTLETKENVSRSRHHLFFRRTSVGDGRRCARSTRMLWCTQSPKRVEVRMRD